MEPTVQDKYRHVEMKSILRYPATVPENGTRR